MKITLERRDQYGAPVYHPIDDAARLFARIAKTKTLTPDTIAAVRARSAAEVERLDAIHQKGVGIYLLSHTQVFTFKNPMGSDFDRYEAALESWYKQKDAVEVAKRQQQQQVEEQQRTWQAKLDGYAKAKTDLKVRDYDDAESTVQETLNVVQQGVVLQGAENPALVVYALGKNPKKAKELAAITDPVKFAFAIAKLESQLKVTSTRKPPAPERGIPVGNAPISGTTDSVLERLRVDAERTGDMTKVIAYRRQQRAKQASAR
jgi:hypothetical protein